VASGVGTGSCETVKKGCNNIDKENMCKTSGASSTGSCVWVSKETTKCQEVKSTCSSLGTQPLCETSGAAVGGNKTPLTCIWISEETDTTVEKCQVVQTSCETINRQVSCEHSGAAASGTGTTYTCVWVTSSEQNGECKTQQELCSSILEKNMCVSKGSANEGNCFWLEKRTNSSGTGDGAARCILRVCCLLLIIYITFIIISFFFSFIFFF
jgi:hypothetical protein